MINLKKNLIFAISFCMLIILIGCSGNKSTTKSPDQIRVGTDGVVASFVPNNPPAIVHVETNVDNKIKVVLQLNNKGAYPQPDEGTAPDGTIYLSGFDRNILKFDPENIDLNQHALDGKSTINPNGGIDFVTFDGTVLIGNLNVDTYEPTLMATTCYAYSSEAGPQVCIDPDPYSTVTQKKVCEVSSTTLSNQGAPVAVTQIDEEALATKTQFRITIKNVGNGDVILGGSQNKCDPYGDRRFGREDIDKVRVQSVTIGSRALDCGPFAGQAVRNRAGDLRLVNKEGSIVCELPRSEYGATNTAYTTPLRIRLTYYYKVTTERKVSIKKEVGSFGGSSIGTGTSPEPTPEPQPDNNGPTATY